MLVTWYIVDRVGLGLDQLMAVESSAWVPRAGPFLAATVLLLAAYFMSGAIWGYMVRDMGGPELSSVVAVQLFMIANLGRYIPGKIWQIAGLAALGKSRGIPARTGAGAAVLGHGLGLVAAASVGMVAFLTGPGPWRLWGMVGAVGIGVIVILTAIPSVFGSMANAWFRIARTTEPPELRSVHALRWLLLFGLNWVMYASAYWILAVSLDRGSGVPFLPVASAFAAAYVLGYLMIFAPAGIGPREAFLIAFLTPHFGAGSSGVIAIVARLWTTVVEVVPAGLFWMRYVRTTAPSLDLTAERDPDE